MKYYVEKQGDKILGKGYISADVKLAENQIEVTEEEYNDIKFESVAVQVEKLEQVEEKMNLEDIRTEFNNEVQQIRNSINGITKKIEDNSRLEKIENVISEMTKEPELTEREKINVKVVAKIRERYSVDDEFKMHRLGLQDQNNIEYLKYLNYVQQCLDWGESEKKKLELGIEE